MARSPLQRGPEKGHYHDSLGVDLSAVKVVRMRVAFDTPGLDQSAEDPQGIPLGPLLPTGSVLLHAGIFQVEPWDENMFARIWAYRAEDPSFYDTPYTEATPDSPNGFDTVQDDGNSWDNNDLFHSGIAICRYPTQMRVGLLKGLGTPSQGSADVVLVYAIQDEP